MVQRYHTILSEHFVKAISDCNEAMCWSAVLCPPEASKQSLPILVVEMNGKLRENKFIQHSNICEAVHILVTKVKAQNHAITTKCCPDSELFTRIRAFEVKCRWMSLRCILAHILGVNFSIDGKSCFVSSNDALQKIGVSTALIKPLRTAQSTWQVVWQ